MSAISIIIRHYNNLSNIESCLSSAFSQEPDLHKKGIDISVEVILVDDGSSESILNKLNSILVRYQSIKLIKSHHAGAVGALNLGIKSSTGDWFTILDCDDELPNQSLSLLWDPNFSYIYGNYKEFPPKSGSGLMIKTGSNIFNTIAGGILFNKNKVSDVGNYDESLFFPEYDLLLKLGINRGKHVDEVVYNYHRNIDSLTNSSKRVLQGKQQLYRKYGRILPIRDYSI